MFAIILSIIFSTNVLVATTPLNTTVPWSDLKNDKSLVRFQSTLLNQTMLTFLNDCYPPKLSSTKQQASCSRYFDAVRQLNSTSFVVQQPIIEKLINESSSDKDFCRQKHTFPAKKYYSTKLAEDFNDTQTCGYLCMQAKEPEGLVPQPICTFLAWMGEQIQIYSSTTPAAAPLAPASVISSANAAHAVTSNEAVGQDLANPAPEKPEIPIIGKPPVSQDNISAQAPAKNETRQTIVQPKQDTKELKENAVAAEAAAAEAAAAEAAAAVAAVPVHNEAEKKQLPPVKEEDAQEVAPALNHDTQEEETQPKDLPPANVDKHDSLPINQPAIDDLPDNDSEVEPGEDVNPDENDDEGDDFDIDSQKSKHKDLPLARPDDNDVDQKSSQEIIGGNYLPNTNHVTDPFLEESGSNFFTYFLIGMFLCIVLYVAYHNKSKILALLLEGRRSDKGRSGRRKHTAAYRKLDSNLEEAITSSASGRTTQIIY